MKTKLTFRLHKNVIEKARKYSARKGESVSQVIEKFFRVLSKEKEEVTPTVRKLKGLLKGPNFDENDHKRFIEEKYL